jgi:hypothetical protein
MIAMPGYMTLQQQFEAGVLHHQCLGTRHFHRTERTVQTFSAWQVRQPIYTRSVGRWRNYERHLGPLFEALGLNK